MWGNSSLHLTHSLSAAVGSYQSGAQGAVCRDVTLLRGTLGQPVSGFEPLTFYS